MISLLKRCVTKFSQNKIPTIQQVTQNWNNFSTDYATIDHCTQTFCYTFANMMEMHKAENILEVACGTGKMIPFLLGMKSPSTSYLASDLSPNMIDLAKKHLQMDFQKYESKLSFDQWCYKQNISFQVINAQQPMRTQKKFDRIICNCVLMLTPDPIKMLTNLYNNSKPGCLLGVSVWGNKEQNNLVRLPPEVIVECGYQPPKKRSNFHLYQQVPKIAEQVGWDLMARWEQNAPFPFYKYDPNKNKEWFDYQVGKLPEYQREKVKEGLDKRVTNVFQDKKILNFSVEMMIIRRK